MKIIILFFISSSTIYAKLFSVKCYNCASTPYVNIAQEIEENVNNKLPQSDPSTYLTGISNAEVMSGKSVGLDYANNIDLFILGASLGFGLMLGDLKWQDISSETISQIKGISVRPTLFLGINLGKPTLFLHAGMASRTFKAIKFKNKNFGLHLRYKILSSRTIFPFKILYWNGLNASLGFERQSLDLSLSQTFNESFQSGSANATIDGPLELNVNGKTNSFPLEISTGLQMIYSLTLFGGLGLDYNHGSVKGKAGGIFPITTPDPNIRMEGSVDLGKEGKPDRWSKRAFVGLQINLPVVKLASIQIDKNLENKSWGLGVKALTIAW